MRMSEREAAKELVRLRLGEGAALVEAMLDEGCVAEIAAVAELTADAYRRGGKLLLFGNGGSAADAIHVAAEFVGRYLVDRPAQPAIALVANASSVTAIGNDYGYDEVFARQLRGLGAAGDVAMGFTTSGRSVNVEKALRAADELGMATVAMTGAEPGPVGAAAGHRIGIPSTETPRIQEGHMLAAHTICEWVEARLVEDEAASA
jgi:D-sedoheptulose 7-phosphate isomerase